MVRKLSRIDYRTANPCDSSFPSSKNAKIRSKGLGFQDTLSAFKLLAEQSTTKIAWKKKSKKSRSKSSDDEVKK